MILAALLPFVLLYAVEFGIEPVTSFEKRGDDLVFLLGKFNYPVR